eukprot:CAMPEP_0197625584 /NCGR_PEP_ID=MMETSP1338-20131121/4911_1 /TAXON_ID=43686 ORGANISM="Pelagodinium beii, Strain RCC1491" /NCGR_SAMPLE_ID=MMETSP1338 /ASSEMBLY_ACC=CAM_ASM_000754 /LENGTH=46 /DNA_ID= /DNA_START= /DNA_END= /DNA_ORIENTATION=
MIYDTKSPMFQQFLVQTRARSGPVAAGPKTDKNTKFEGGKPGSFEV